MFWDIRVVPSHNPPDIWEHFTLMPTTNFQKHPEIAGLCLQCQWFQADPGKAEVENATPQKKASQCVACTLFCYVLLCFVCSRYCAILCFDHDCQQLSTSTSMSSSSSVSSLSYFSVLVQTFPYFSNAVVIIKKTFGSLCVPFWRTNNRKGN